MEKQKLSNATAVLILGICSILLCLCWGLGIILGIVALVIAKKDLILYYENPSQYSGFANINTGRILSIIGIILGAITLIFYLYLNSLGEERLKGILENLEEKAKYEQEQ